MENEKYKIKKIEDFTSEQKDILYDHSVELDRKGLK